MEAKGVIIGEKIARLRFSIGGKLTSIGVSPGSLVSAGKTIATLDTSASQAYLDRVLKLYDKERVEFDKKVRENVSEDQRRLLQDNLDISVKNVEIAKSNLDECILTTPLSGTVAAIDPEGTVTGVVISPAGFVITVVDTSALQFRCLLHGAERLTISTDKPAMVRIDGIGREIDGTVRMTGILPDADGLYPVVVGLNDISGLIPGLPGTLHWS